MKLIRLSYVPKIKILPRIMVASSDGRLFIVAEDKKDKDGKSKLTYLRDPKKYYKKEGDNYESPEGDILSEESFRDKVKQYEKRKQELMGGGEKKKPAKEKEEDKQKKNEEEKKRLDEAVKKKIEEKKKQEKELEQDGYTKEKPDMDLNKILEEDPLVEIGKQGQKKYSQLSDKQKDYVMGKIKDGVAFYKGFDDYDTRKLDVSEITDDTTIDTGKKRIPYSEAKKDSELMARIQEQVKQGVVKHSGFGKEIKKEEPPKTEPKKEDATPTPPAKVEPTKSEEPPKEDVKPVEQEKTEEPKIEEPSKVQPPKEETKPTEEPKKEPKLLEAPKDEPAKTEPPKIDDKLDLVTPVDEKKPEEQKEPESPKVDKTTQKPHKMVKKQQIDISRKKQKNTFPLHEQQISSSAIIKLPNGTKKKYSDLNGKEKESLHKAIASGRARHKGFNDYNDISVKTMKSNMANNLNKYADKSVKERVIAKDVRINHKNVSKVVKSLKSTMGSVIAKHKKMLTKDTHKIMNRHVEEVLSSVKEAVMDGSMKDVSSREIDEFLRDDLKRLLHQDVETRGRSLGDHGIRHCASNAHNTFTILNSLHAGGVKKVNGKMKLMGLSIMVNHDLGYTVGGAGYKLSDSGKHKENSGMMAREEFARYEKIFGKDSAREMCGTSSEVDHGIIQDHDVSDYDWQTHPLQSSVALSDCTALWGVDKVQDLFIRSKDAMKVCCKLKTIEEGWPPPPKKTKKEDFKDDESFQEAQITYDNDVEQDKKSGNEEIRKSVESDFNKVRKQLHTVIDREQYEDSDKEQLHKQVEEMGVGKFSTTKDILSRISGKLKGFKYQKKQKMVVVDMDYSAEGNIVDSIFGDDIAAHQFRKFEGDMHAAKIERGKDADNDVVTFSKDGKKFVQIKIKGVNTRGKKSIKTDTTEALKEYKDNTIRDELRHIRKNVMTTDKPQVDADQIINQFEKDKNIKKLFSMGEWEQFKNIIKKNEKDIPNLTKILGAYPLLNKERDYIFKKVASILMAIAPRKEPDMKPPRDDLRVRYKKEDLKREDMADNKDTLLDKDLKTARRARFWR